MLTTEFNGPRRFFYDRTLQLQALRGAALRGGQGGVALQGCCPGLLGDSDDEIRKLITELRADGYSDAEIQKYIVEEKGAPSADVARVMQGKTPMPRSLKIAGGVGLGIVVFSLGLWGLSKLGG